MKKRTSAKMKNLSVLLALVMLIAAVFPNYALAADSQNDGIDLYSTLTDEDLSINAEVATCVAELFVKDMIATGTTVWDEDTEPVNTVTMYDETGETPTAYSVELTKGYVVVSAYIDVPNIILEWADDTTPYYHESAAVPAFQDVNHETKVIYLGGLSYYIDNGRNELTSVMGENVERTALSCSLDEIRSVENISYEIYSLLSESPYGVEVHAEGDFNDKKGEIDDVIAYARKVYVEGTWTCNDYKNYWENWLGNCVYSMVRTPGSKVDESACCPIAITNLIMMQKQRRYKDWTYGTSEYINIFNSVKNMKYFLLFPYYIPDVGVGRDSAKNYVVDAFKSFGETPITIGSHGHYTDSNGCTQIHLTPIIETCKDPNRLMLMYLHDGENHGYKSHYVVGYAYNRIVNKEKNIMRTFTKIRDGITVGPRYLDVYNFGEISMYIDIILPAER